MDQIPMTADLPADLGDDDDLDLAGVRRPRTGKLSGKTGLLPRQEIRKLVRRKVLRASQDFAEGQFQPASLDLRLGAKAYRVRASFLPGRASTVEDKLSELQNDVIDLERGAVLEKGCVYVVELLEHLAGGYQGRLYAEISPRSFSIKARTGSRLNQLRFRRRNSQHGALAEFRLSDRDLRELHDRVTLVEGEFQARHGLLLHIELGGFGRERLVGYRAQ